MTTKPQRTAIYDRMPKRLIPLHLLLLLAAPAAAQPLADVVRQAEALEPLETLIVARAGEILVEKGFRGHATTAPTNVKSVSKTILSALVGIAIDRGLLEGPDQKVAPLLRDKLPADPDPRLHGITIGNLLSMQAGLQRTSGPHYGRWVASHDWVRAALDQPFVGEPGGGMLYSTGNSHLLSAILTRVGGRSTLALAHDWLAPLAEFAIADWMRDPQGIYFGGNQMAMTPRALLAFGELYRNGGQAGGRQVLSPGWIETSWQPRTQSVFHDDLYGYGWFLTRMGGHAVAYAWGYGGQMVYVVPGLGLTVVMTSAADRPSARNGHRDDLRRLLALNLGMRLLIAHGRSDLVTPYGVSRYVLDHLPQEAGAGRASLALYKGGHMFYFGPASRSAFTDDAEAFYQGTAP